MNFFCNTTGRLPVINQSLAVYEFTCPDCKLRGKNQDNVIWTTCWALWSDQNSIVKNHLDCAEVQYQLNIMSLRPALFSDDDIESGDNRNLRINLVINNTKIIEHYKNNILLFKEAMRINKIKPTPNTGLKASKELQLFYGASRHHVLISCN